VSIFRSAKNKLLAKLFTKFPKLVNRWAEKTTFQESLDIPWTPLKKEIKDCRIALITTGGVHLKSQPPFDMKNPDGDPTYREIPRDTPLEDLTITHDYYNHSDADQDINIIFPVERLKELACQHVIGEEAPFHYGFMGHIDKDLVNILRQQTAPEVAKKLKNARIDAVLLTPA
jgi:D-proline reductase (dithiol) PrdB